MSNASVKASKTVYDPITSKILTIFCKILVPVLLHSYTGWQESGRQVFRQQGVLQGPLK